MWMFCLSKPKWAGFTEAHSLCVVACMCGGPEMSWTHQQCAAAGTCNSVLTNYNVEYLRNYHYMSDILPFITNMYLFVTNTVIELHVFFWEQGWLPHVSPQSNHILNKTVICTHAWTTCTGVMISAHNVYKYSTFALNVLHLQFWQFKILTVRLKFQSVAFLNVFSG